jgi:hypothetical protein
MVGQYLLKKSQNLPFAAVRWLQKLGPSRKIKDCAYGEDFF